MTSYAGTVADQIGAEIGSAAAPSPEFIAKYAEGMAKRYTQSLRGQVKDANGNPAALDEALHAWNTAAAELAAAEAVRARHAFTRHALEQANAKEIRWSGGNLERQGRRYPRAI